MNILKSNSQLIKNIHITGYNFTEDSVSAKVKDVDSTSTTYHRIVEAMKFAYGMRSNLGDPEFADITEVSKME